jgi:hypothetical protein
VKVIKRNNTVSILKDGALQATYTITSPMPNISATTKIGYYLSSDQRWFYGWIDEFIITKY